MTNTTIASHRQEAGLTLIELMISLALCSSLLTLIISTYVRVKVAAQSHEQQAELAQYGRWLSATVADNIKNAATLAYLAADTELDEQNPCQWLEQNRLPSAAHGIDRSNRRDLAACFKLDQLAADDVLLLARDGETLFDANATPIKTTEEAGIDLYAVEKRTNATDYGCASNQELTTLVRYRHRHGKRPYKEELLPGIAAWTLSYGLAGHNEDVAEIHFAPASAITRWQNVRAVRVHVSLAPVCGQQPRNSAAATQFSWIQTVALRQTPLRESHDASPQ